MKRSGTLLAGGLALLLAATTLAQSEGRPSFAEAAEGRRVLVTVVEPPTDVLAQPLTAAEFEARVEKQAVEILRVYQPEERPVRLALLIDDSAGAPVAGSLDALAGFLRSLPHGSEVMIAYLRRGKVVTAQAWTSNLEGAARSLRAPSGVPGAGPADLGDLISEVLRLFPARGTGARAQILYVGEGTSADPHTDIPLQRTLRQARARGLAVFAIHVHAPEGFAPQSPQAAAETANQEAYLDWLTRETGGMTFGLRLRSLALDPHLRRFRQMLDRQYLLEVAAPAGEGSLRLRLRQREAELLYPRR